MSDKKLQRYYSRLATEGMVKALLWGVAIGFALAAVLGGIYWLMDWKSAWVCPIVWAVVSAGAAYALYQWKFKPTTKYIARRVDDLGLHERILTMTELEGDESYIAQLQRKDALAALEKIGPELLKIGVSKNTIITSAVSSVLGIGLMTVALLSAAGIIKSGQQVLNPDGNGPLTTYTVTYAVKDGMGQIQFGGTMMESVEQKVVAGEMSEGVAAVAADGWAFLRWTDLNENPYREDEITDHVTYLAVFVEVSSGFVGNINDNAPQDAPGDQQGSPDSNPEKDAEQGNEAKGKYEEVNQVINGETYYGDLYDEAYKDVMDELAGSTYDGATNEIIGGYFDNIEKDKTEEENE